MMLSRSNKVPLSEDSLSRYIHITKHVLSLLVSTIHLVVKFPSCVYIHEYCIAACNWGLLVKSLTHFSCVCSQNTQHSSYLCGQVPVHVLFSQWSILNVELGYTHKPQVDLVLSMEQAFPVLRHHKRFAISNHRVFPNERLRWHKRLWRKVYSLVWDDDLTDSIQSSLNPDEVGVLQMIFTQYLLTRGGVLLVVSLVVCVCVCVCVCACKCVYKVVCV